MKIPKFKSEAEEADWLYAHRKEIETALLKEKPKKMVSVARILERETRTQPISIRLAVADIECAKEQAKAKGIGYQTLIRMLVHDSLLKSTAGSAQRVSAARSRSAPEASLSVKRSVRGK